MKKYLPLEVVPDKERDEKLQIIGQLPKKQAKVTTKTPKMPRPKGRGIFASRGGCSYYVEFQLLPRWRGRTI